MWALDPAMFEFGTNVSISPGSNGYGYGQL
jgi:hypothetical protein